VFNDIVSIILFNTVQQFKHNFEFTIYKPFEILYQFFILGLFSVLIGAVTGMVSSLLFKWFRFLTHTAITETSVLFILALISYFAADSFEYSGMSSLLTCGIVMGHYTWYNLSPQGKTISSVSFSIFGQMAEAVVFTFIGLCTFTYESKNDVTPGPP
jgi:sodium/hydrogen exchanger-like protein 6/7/sodium/hydrogen exchanger 8